MEVPPGIANKAKWLCGFHIFWILLDIIYKKTQTEVYKVSETINFHPFSVRIKLQSCLAQRTNVGENSLHCPN